MLEKKEKIQIPMMALRALTVFPNMAISFPVGRQKSLDALEAAEEQDKRIFLVAQRDPEDASPEQMGLYEFGTVATIKQILKLPGNVTHVIVEGVERGRLETVQKKRSCIHIARLSSFWFSTGSVSSADATGFSFSKLLSGDTAKTMPSVLRFALVKGTMTRTPGTTLSSKCSGML